MPGTRESTICRYHYDPLDRLAALVPSTKVDARLFYLKDRLVTEDQGQVKHALYQHDNQLLAQQRHENSNVGTTLLATDLQRSVLQALDATRNHPLAYTPYGHHSPGSGLLSLPGFNGERRDPVTGHYLLGNGYRAFNPVLMRFNSADGWSPFGRGGLSAYAYCLGDPVNRVDPTGHWSFRGFIRWLGSKLSRIDLSGGAAKGNTKKFATKTESQSSISNGRSDSESAIYPIEPTLELQRRQQQLEHVSTTIVLIRVSGGNPSELIISRQEALFKQVKLLSKHVRSGGQVPSLIRNAGGF